MKITTFIYQFYFFLFMKKMLLVISILMVLTFLAACSPAEQVIPKTEVSATNEKTTAPVLEEQTMPASDTMVVKITSSGFEPKMLTVKAGTMVTFVNGDSNKHWPASAMHPTHTLYPGSGIEKCGTGEAIFDACQGLAQGDSFSFTFNEKGSWKYHDHLRVSSTGTVIVE